MLADVLAEMLADVSDIAKRGGRVVAHNLAFDGEIIMGELAKATATPRPVASMTIADQFVPAKRARIEPMERVERI